MTRWLPLAICLLVTFILFVNSKEEDGVCGAMEDQCHTKKPMSYRWIPEEKHRCNIRKLDRQQFLSEFGVFPPLYHEPIILQLPLDRNKVLRNMTSQKGIVDSLPLDFQVTLSSSNSFSAHRRTIPLTQYLEEILETGETTPDERSNETWYLFGETYSEEWKDLLTHYVLPPCRSCTSDLVALSFGIGNRGSGVQWHVHGPGFAETLWGRKHWILYPADEKPVFHPDQTSRNWMEYTYTDLFSESNSDRLLPYECTLLPGEVIYFPNMWWHATINLEKYTSFISTFTVESGQLD